MNWYWIFYWIGILDSVHFLMETILVFSVIVLIIGVVGYYMTLYDITDSNRRRDDEEKNIRE